MKKLIVGVALSIVSLSVNAQFWAQGGGGGSVKVCAAYRHGKFSGHNGTRPKFIQKGASYRMATRSRKYFTTRRRGGLSLFK